MEVAKEQKKGTANSFFVYCCAKGFQKPSTEAMGVQETNGDVTTAGPKKRKPGGWRAMPYILGNETLERLAGFGLFANFMVYLMRKFHLEQVSAANLLNIWSGVSSLAPILGAFISDAYVGRFKTIGFAMCSSFLGMLILTLTAWLPSLHPTKCDFKPGFVDHCAKPNSLQMGVLLMGLGFITIGSGGIRACNIPFGVDQFDPTTEEGVKGISSFFNWYYTSFTVVILMALTLVVYIQDSVSWVLGFGVLALSMLCAIVVFFIGTRIYVHVKPEGSIFSGIGQVLVAAYKKRGIILPDDDSPDGEKDKSGVYYDPPLTKNTVVSKLPLTDQFRFLNKAAIIQENDLDSNGNRVNPWRLTTVQAVEEVKCLIRVIPITVSGIVSLTAVVQQGTFTLSQALVMDRHLGPKFQIPAGSVFVISMITIALWLPFYDLIVVPNLRRITKHEGGITLLQRIGVGIAFSILSMVAAGMVEKERRSMALLHPNAPQMSVFWLAPQLILMGFCEAFNNIGQIEFYNKQFPEHMRSIANALFSCSYGGASYLTTLVTVLVHRYTGTKNHPDWLTNNLNAGRLDYFYYVLAIVGLVNLVYYLYCAQRYRYKAVASIVEDKSCNQSMELSSCKV